MTGDVVYEVCRTVWGENVTKSYCVRALAKYLGVSERQGWRYLKNGARGATASAIILVVALHQANRRIHVLEQQFAGNKK
jgi:hypothetical protein